MEEWYRQQDFFSQAKLDAVNEWTKGDKIVFTSDLSQLRLGVAQMATYTNTGWKATNLTYTGRSSSNNPYTAGEFSEAIPTRAANRKTDANTSRPEETSTQIYVKIKNGRVVDLKNDGKDYQGNDWERCIY